MKPKPFWPLNHFTVPVGISFLHSAHAQNSRDHHATNSILTMFLEEKEPAGAFNKAQRLIECRECRHFCSKIQGPQRNRPHRGRRHSVSRTPHQCVFPCARRRGMVASIGRSERST